MAIKKTITIKGVDFEYWKIIQLVNNAVENTTSVVLAGYKSQEVREESVGNFVQETLRSYVYGGELDKAQAYAEIKASRKKLVEVSPAQYATYDAEGNELNPDVPAVYEEVEVNDFANAEDI